MSSVEKVAGRVVVKPSRDVVASMTPEFRTELKALVDEGTKELIIDLDGVAMVDSVGLGIFVATHNSLAKNGGKLSIVNASEDIFKLFRAMRLDQHFEVKATGH